MGSDPQGQTPIAQPTAVRVGSASGSKLPVTGMITPRQKLPNKRQL